MAKSKDQPRDRKERVLEIREQVENLLESRGEWDELGPHRAKRFRGEGFDIIYRCPQEEQRRFDTDYGIEMWAQGTGKVLNIAWNQGEAIEIRAFKRGTWEYRLLSLNADRVAVEG